MVISIPITSETEARLRAKAAAAGMDLETFAAQSLQRIAERPSLDEMLQPLRDEFESSGMDGDQLTEFLESVKHENRAERRTSRQERNR